MVGERWVRFSAGRPAWWRRHVVTAHIRSRAEDGRPDCAVVPIARFWSWDRADDLAEALNQAVRDGR